MINIINYQIYLIQIFIHEMKNKSENVNQAIELMNESKILKIEVIIFIVSFNVYRMCFQT